MVLDESGLATANRSEYNWIERNIHAVFYKSSINEIFTCFRGTNGILNYKNLISSSSTATRKPF